MIHHVRPDRPKDFPPERIQRAEAALRASVGAESCVAHWQDYKTHFYESQHHKCAWCEAENTTETGAVDHYRPKGAVGQLETAGQEVEGCTNVRGRTVRPLHAPGYWWLAYDWDNWLFACNRCNSAWKLSLFPVCEQPYPKPDPGTACTPLLLDPFGAEDPIDHLDFSALGQIEPWNGSPRGRATIDTCGLDRESLRRAREKVVKLTWIQAQLVEQATTDRQLNLALLALRRLGDASSPFAGTARAVIRRELGLPWSDLEALPLQPQTS